MSLNPKCRNINSHMEEADEQFFYHAIERNASTVDNVTCIAPAGGVFSSDPRKNGICRWNHV